MWITLPKVENSPRNFMFQILALAKYRRIKEKSKER